MNPYEAELSDESLTILRSSIAATWRNYDLTRLELRFLVENRVWATDQLAPTVLEAYRTGYWRGRSGGER